MRVKGSGQAMMVKRISVQNGAPHVGHGPTNALGIIRVVPVGPSLDHDTFNQIGKNIRAVDSDAAIVRALSSRTSSRLFRSLWRLV
jgi:hypothetical protein